MLGLDGLERQILALSIPRRLFGSEIIAGGIVSKRIAPVVPSAVASCITSRITPRIAPCIASLGAERTATPIIPISVDAVTVAELTLSLV